MNKWLQIDAEQNEEWLRKQGTGTYIDLSAIKKGDLPGQVILEKHNGYKEALKKESIGDGKRISLPDTKRSGGNREIGVIQAFDRSANLDGTIGLE